MKIELGYKSKEFEINKDTIKEFYLLENRRRLKENKVLSLKSNLKEGIHFESPIVINQLSKKRVIDGQHRITAMQKLLKEMPEIKIPILLVSYSDKTIGEEREIFHRWNAGSRQTQEDYLMMFEDEIPMMKMVKIFPIPISVYRDKGNLRFKTLAGSYIAAKRNMKGGHRGTNEDFIADCKELERKDYNFMKEFWEGYRTHISNVIDTKNVFCGTSFIDALIYVYFWNQKFKDIFWEKAKRAIQNEKIIMLSKTGGRTATEMILSLLIENMSTGSDRFEIEPINRVIPENSKEAKKKGKDEVNRLVKEFGGKKTNAEKKAASNVKTHPEINEFIQENKRRDTKQLRNMIGEKLGLWISEDQINDRKRMLGLEVEEDEDDTDYDSPYDADDDVADLEED